MVYIMLTDEDIEVIVEYFISEAQLLPEYTKVWLRIYSKSVITAIHDTAKLLLKFNNSQTCTLINKHPCDGPILLTSQSVLFH